MFHIAPYPVKQRTPIALPPAPPLPLALSPVPCAPLTAELCTVPITSKPPPATLSSCPKSMHIAHNIKTTTYGTVPSLQSCVRCAMHCPLSPAPPLTCKTCARCTLSTALPLCCPLHCPLSPVPPLTSKLCTVPMAVFPIEGTLLDPFGVEPPFPIADLPSAPCQWFKFSLGAVVPLSHAPTLAR